MLVDAQPQVECPYLEPNQGKCRDDEIGFVCSECRGTGRVPNPRFAGLLEVLEEKCPVCRGTGCRYLVRGHDHGVDKRYACSSCHGTGFVSCNWKVQHDGAYRGALLVAVAKAHLGIDRCTLGSASISTCVLYSASDEEANQVVIEAMGR